MLSDEIQKLQEWMAESLLKKDPLEIDDVVCNKIIKPKAGFGPKQKVERYFHDRLGKQIKALKVCFPMLCKILGEERFRSEVGLEYIAQNPIKHERKLQRVSKNQSLKYHAQLSHGELCKKDIQMI